MEDNKFNNLEENCSLCSESELSVGQKTQYGGIVVYKKGDKKNGWFATLSPKTLGNPEKDFTIQIMPMSHLRHISQIDNSDDLAKNYGATFAKISRAINDIMKEENRHLENEENMIRIGTYGKSKHHKEHLHIKLFPWEHPYVVDSTYEKKEIHFDKEGEEFIKMAPIKKFFIAEKRFKYLAEKLMKAFEEENDRR